MSQHFGFGVRAGILASAMTLFVSCASFAAPPESDDGHAMHEMAAPNSGGHEMGHGDQKFYMFDGPAVPSADYKVTTSHYYPPDVTLRDQTGKEVGLSGLLAEDRPVALQFVFTSCATICPVLSATFAQADDALKALAPRTLLLSISIDPEYDTPERLAQYAARYGASGNWMFLTGESRDVREVIRTFDGLFQSNNKLYHRPYTYIRRSAGDPWVRVDGLMSKSSFLKEFERVIENGSGHVSAHRH